METKGSISTDESVAISSPRSWLNDFMGRPQDDPVKFMRNSGEDEILSPITEAEVAVYLAKLTAQRKSRQIQSSLI